MKEKTTLVTPASHHLLTSRPQYFDVVIQMAWRLCAPVRRLRLSIFSLALAAFLAALSPALALAKSGPKQTGKYDFTISGYYRGAGFANASPSTVAISANVKDEAGKPHRLTAPALARDAERHYLFSGTGSLDGMEVSIDGRVDAPDPQKGDVLKAGRIVFTFKVIPNGKHGRGGGEMRANGNGGGNSGGTGNRQQQWKRKWEQWKRRRKRGRERDRERGKRRREQRQVGTTVEATVAEMER